MWCEKPSNCQLEYTQHGGLTCKSTRRTRRPARLQQACSARRPDRRCVVFTRVACHHPSIVCHWECPKIITLFKKVSSDAGVHAVGRSSGSSRSSSSFGGGDRGGGGILGSILRLNGSRVFHHILGVEPGEDSLVRGRLPLAHRVCWRDVVTLFWSLLPRLREHGGRTAQHG